VTLHSPVTLIRDAPCPLFWTRRSSISSCLLRTGRRRPTNREGSAESIEDRQGIRSTQYVLSGAWFGDGRACCLLLALGYSSSLIYRLVFSPSLEEKLGGSRLDMRRKRYLPTHDVRFHPSTFADVAAPINQPRFQACTETDDAGRFHLLDHARHHFDRRYQQRRSLSNQRHRGRLA
jgi:hypothetical protein